MKKTLLLLAAIGMIFTACEGGDGFKEENGGTPFVPEITISPEELSFPVEGAEEEVIITANFEYEVSTRVSWLSVKQTKTGLVVTAEESNSTSERNAYILITNENYSISKTIDIVQEARKPKIELAEQTIEVEFEHDEYEVLVTSQYSWRATSDNDWIVVTTETGIAGEEVLKFSVKRNEEEQERKGTITLKNSNYNNLVAELYVSQKAFVPEFEISATTSYDCDYKGGVFTVAVTSNFDYDVTTTADWVIYTKDAEGVKVSVQKHSSIDSRSAEVKIYSEKYNLEGRTISITQSAVPIEIGAIITKNGAQGVVFNFNNTQTMIVSVEERRMGWYAANDWCSNYGEGWYFPNRYELGLIYNNIKTINAALDANGYTTLSEDDYWTCAKTNSGANAYYFSFENGTSDYCSPSNTFYVRAVLVF